MCERVWRTSALEREREEERERTKERRRGGREKEERGRGRGSVFSFSSHFLLFRPRYTLLHICFWMHSDDVATFFPSSSLSHSLSHTLSIFSTHIPLSLSLSLSTLPNSLSLFLPPLQYTHVHNHSCILPENGK